MRAPRWFNDALARHRAQAVEDNHADGDAIRDLTVRILGDEEFTREIVTEYAARRLGTKRDHAKRSPWKDPAKRMAYIAQLHREGMKIRQIAGYVGVSVGTVHADLQRWEAECSTVSALPFKNPVHHASPTSSDAHVLNAGTEQTATVTALRRQA